MNEQLSREKLDHRSVSLQLTLQTTWCLINIQSRNYNGRRWKPFAQQRLAAHLSQTASSIHLFFQWLGCRNLLRWLTVLWPVEDSRMKLFSKSCKNRANYLLNQETVFIPTVGGDNCSNQCKQSRFGCLDGWKITAIKLWLILSWIQRRGNWNSAVNTRSEALGCCGNWGQSILTILQWPENYHVRERSALKGKERNESRAERQKRFC